MTHANWDRNLTNPSPHGATEAIGTATSTCWHPIVVGKGASAQSTASAHRARLGAAVAQRPENSADGTQIHPPVPQRPLAHGGDSVKLSHLREEISYKAVTLCEKMSVPRSSLLGRCAGLMIRLGPKPLI